MKVLAYRWTRSDGEVFLIDPREIQIAYVSPDSGPATPSPVAGPVIHTTPTENRESA